MDGPGVEKIVKAIRAKYCSDLTRLKAEEAKVKEDYERKLELIRRNCIHEVSGVHSFLCVWCGADMEPQSSIS